MSSTRKIYVTCEQITNFTTNVAQGKILQILATLQIIKCYYTCTQGKVM